MSEQRNARLHTNSTVRFLLSTAQAIVPSKVQNLDCYKEIMDAAVPLTITCLKNQIHCRILKDEAQCIVDKMQKVVEVSCKLPAEMENKAKYDEALDNTIAMLTLLIEAINKSHFITAFEMETETVSKKVFDSRWSDTKAYNEWFAVLGDYWYAFGELVKHELISAPFYVEGIKASCWTNEAIGWNKDMVKLLYDLAILMNTSYHTMLEAGTAFSIDLYRLLDDIYYRYYADSQEPIIEIESAVDPCGCISNPGGGNSYTHA